MDQDDPKKIVIDYAKRMVEQGRRENPTATFFDFPDFHDPVESYIYGALYIMFADYREFTVRGTLTLLGNLGGLRELKEAEAFKAYTEICEYAQTLDNDMKEMYFKDHPEMRKEISCKKGCSWCCYQSVQLNGLEAQVLWKEVPKDMVYLEQQKVFKELLEKDRIHQRNYARKLGMKKARCRFLDEKEECSIYDHRPLVCRYYAVYDPPELCKPLTVPDILVTSLPVFMAVLEAAMFAEYGVGVLQIPNQINRLK